MQITENKQKHILAVARKMRRLTIQCHQLFPLNPEAMFTLGFLHDIGYEISETSEKHAEAGGLLLKKQGYKYWQEVYYHGFPQTEYSSPALDLLNYADLTTGPNGEDMTVQERLEDIAKRYGKNPEVEKNAKKLVEMLRKKMPELNM